MNLILSDKYLSLNLKQDTKFIDLSVLNISNCIGCFGCWTKTPGKCVIRDDATKVYPYIAQSERVIYISKISFGSYDSIMKTMLERSIPIQQAFIRLLDGETHHIQRDVALKDAIIIGYGDVDKEEKEIFKKLIERNAKNMNFKQYKILFIEEQNLQATVEKEIIQWGK